MSYKKKIVTKIGRGLSCNLEFPVNYQLEDKEHFVFHNQGPCYEVPNNKSYRSLTRCTSSSAWNIDYTDVAKGTSLYTTNITGCIVVAAYCSDPSYLGMVHFGAIDSGHVESYKRLLDPVEVEDRSKVFAVCALSAETGQWFAVSAFENYILPLLLECKIPAANILLYHDTTEDYMSFGVRNDGYIGTPVGMRKADAKIDPRAPLIMKTGQATSTRVGLSLSK